MGSVIVVISEPVGAQNAGVNHSEKQFLVEELVVHATVEALAQAVMHRLPRLDVEPLDACHFRPGEDRIRGECGTVIRDDHAGLAAPP